MFVEDLTGYFTDFGQAATLAGAAVTVIFDITTVDEGPGALTQFTTCLLAPATGVTPTVGQALVVGATTYTVRQVLLEPPDGALKRLVVTR